MGRVGVVASCSSGFGRQVAEKMASLGDRVNAATRCPSDGHALAGSSPPVVHETRAGIGGMFDQIFSDSSATADPAIVVDLMIDLATMKPGTRPFCTVAGIDFGVRDRNAAVEPHDTGLLEASGLTDFATVRTVQPDQARPAIARL
ncbi:MAG TPA: hypothetical protein PLF84_08865 [Bryobacteraceae bacterium]|nr:hypothetical protein [Bryobacterales bacterium]HRJ19143.1 hypothetical protein [Bryobacteraceae bacterium]